MKGFFFPEACAAKKGTGHVEKDYEEIGGCAAGCMIQSFIFSLDDEGAASEFMDDVSGWSKSLAFSFQAEIDTSKMLGRSPLMSKGLDRMGGGGQGAFFLERSQSF